jgi:enoyl-CoA hydratase/carnithine racemase
MPKLERDGAVFVLRLEPDDENRFSLDWLAGVEVALDEVEAAVGSGPAALVTAGSGKFFSNGLDLDWVAGHRDSFVAYADRVELIYARLLAAAVPTVAAVNGHAFAAGGMLVLVHDQRVMRADRGFFCLPEVTIHIPFTPGMTALCQTTMPVRTAHAAMTTGRRYGGGEALAAGIVDAVAPEDEVLGAAVERARALAATAGPTLGTIKERFYADALAQLRAPSTPDVWAGVSVTAV